jgi:multiple sugar transport system permease protein
VVSALILAAGLGMMLTWRQLKTRQLQRELALERKSGALAQRLATVMHHANDIIILADDRLRILEANQRALESYSYTLEEFQTLEVSALRAPEARANLVDFYRRLQSEEQVLTETVHIRKNGTTFPVEVSARRSEVDGVTCSLAAYGFARYKFPGSNVVFALSIGLLIVPFQAIIIPEYLLLRQLDWLNSFRALIVPGVFSAFAMFLLRQAFLQIPLELEESAMIDGANPLQILRYITLPLSGAALAAFAVITVQAAWNDFMFPLVVANTPDTRVVTIGISLLQGERSTPWNLLMMGSFLATMPMLILFVVLQRYFIQGVAMTGVKG